MFRRAFWFTAGAAAGVWATTKVHRTLKRLTPESLAAQAAGKAIDTGQRLRDFALDVRDGMAQREAELGEALGLSAPADPGAARMLPATRPRPALAGARAPEDDPRSEGARPDRLPHPAHHTDAPPSRPPAERAGPPAGARRSPRVPPAAHPRGARPAPSAGTPPHPHEGTIRKPTRNEDH
jgi:hypothetical protein